VDPLWVGGPVGPPGYTCRTVFRRVRPKDGTTLIALSPGAGSPLQVLEVRTGRGCPR